ncbi:hypothetical protein SAPIO_CDS0237 [Scedosporium apiospermum]|uniref:Uncharacterized protein n=1 Tax=Pseudallescheria apiosperma TaxID=563466 RepID=A0A084GHT8_PSEDA|nr:uncharacterized protein SAPIO_CDS0237 [Scedosporium apiospermum]KEZ46900.1 hypothetical protein SAPIO_CDS0237 [Scedosporium apiospermum]
MFRPTAARLVRFVGPLDAVDSPFASTIRSAGHELETRFPIIVEGRVQGSRPHPSTKDPTDQKDVVTVSFHTNAGTLGVEISTAQVFANP